MSHYPKTVLNLIKNLSRLPGIGEKTAERLAVHILKAPRAAAEALSKSILEAREKTGVCRRCFALSDREVCDICLDTSRSDSLLCVVEQPADMASVEKSGAFKGRYHILSGVLSPLNGVGPDEIRFRELMSRMERENIQEVIIATGTNVEGEATASFIARSLEKYPAKVTRIASGVPMGGDLKYIDPLTLRKALETRRGL
jgi:recombination protein RecR